MRDELELVYDAGVCDERCVRLVAIAQRAPHVRCYRCGLEPWLRDNSDEWN